MREVKNGADTSALVTLQKLIDKASKEKIPLTPIRYKPLTKKEAYEGDYDFLLPQSAHNRFFRLLFKECRSDRINFLIDRKKAFKTVIVLQNRTDTRGIELELWSLLDVKESGRSSFIPYEKIAPFIREATGGTTRLDPEIEGLYYLSHLATKQKKLSTPLVRLRCDYYLSLLIKEQKDFAVSLYRALLEEKISIETAARQANQYLQHQGFLPSRIDFRSEIRLRWRKGLHRILSKMKKQIPITPVMGPDGVGKTTVIGHLSKTDSKLRHYRFKKSFRNAISYKILNLFTYDRKSEEKNQADDRNGHLIFFIALIHFPFLLFKGWLGRQHLLSDRYYHDLLFMNLRFPQKPARLRPRWELLLRLIPPTYRMVQLDAPVPIILQRKKELEPEDIAFYTTTLFELYLQKPPTLYLYINTANTPDHFLPLAKGKEFEL